MINSKSFSRNTAGQKRMAGYIQRIERKKKKNLQPRLLHPAKISLKVDEKSKDLQTSKS